MAKKKEAPAVEKKPENPKVKTPVVEAVKSSGYPKSVKVELEELMKLQAQGKLIGYDPNTKIALIKE